MKDHQVVTALRKGGRKEAGALRFLYKKHFPPISTMVMQQGASQDEARDVFQETVVAFVRSVQQGRFEERSAIGTYLYAIARNLWRMQLRKQRPFRVEKEPSGDEVATPLALLLKKEQRQLVKTVVNQLEPDCRKILRMAVYEEMPMVKIAQQMGHSSDQVSRNKKSRCLKYLSRIIASSGLFSTLKTYPS